MGLREAGDPVLGVGEGRKDFPRVGVELVGLGGAAGVDDLGVRGDDGDDDIRIDRI